MKFKKVVVCGVGLIGGSFALALKQAGVAGEIVGLGRRPEALAEALERGVIDRAAGDWAEALTGAELVMLAVPVGQMPALLTAMAPHLAASTLVTDAGSTKSDVVAAARAALGTRSACFIPGHPIAGAEKSGVDAATADLFRGKRVVLTPLEENAPGAVEHIAALWAACGAEVSRLTPEAHDRIFAAVSHLPHVLAFALVHEFAGRAEADLLFGFAAGGFRDFTRIAGSSPEMWRDICLANRPALLAELDAYMVELMRTRVLLAGADAEGLLALFTAARQRREAWLQSQPAVNE
ncbi:MAG: prephenate dehydrogenase/arogenate dehydrogenase family protein [Betaproteobacteria bacterium HGW-Betaproteobacteria-11]|nr:MAG: prephenate dehydrogenase/arogenate dehydrogenase family protein [Betaproteobacteria bacterium HGW-Betaproteobacteria-11]